MTSITEPTQDGFTLLRQANIAELRTRARLFRHDKTGAQLLSLENNDENKCFGITFRTPPSDSTGVAHILEHSVLCGSRKYPLKEPFIELAKGSLKTFLNAMTGDAETYYPVASTNLQDFYNLVDVYLDSIFYPRLTAHTFAQEGWHFELEDPAEPLIFKGVVFNEMKGYYASPDVRLDVYSKRTVFPDNAFGLDAGGDPATIPNLTYETLRNFHQTFYHPSNAFIVFYGDDPAEERLRLMNTWLGEFDRREINSEVPLQARFTEPRRFEFPYPVEEGSPNVDKGHVVVTWMLDATTDRQKLFELGLLAYVLIHTPASPLRKALIDAGLGEDAIGGEGGNMQRTFQAGLKGISPANADKVENLILQTLREQVAEGLDPETIAAAVNTIEFHLREFNTGSFPRGLAMMFHALRLWLYGGDPLAALVFEAPLNAVKARLAAGEPLFEDLIQRHLLDNSHRTTVVLVPHPSLAERENAQERERLEQARHGMTEEEVQRILEDTRELKRLQDIPDPPELLATIPSLQLSDLDKKNKTTPLEALEMHGGKLLYHDLFTQGILYFDVGFDLHQLPGELLSYVPLFGRALTELGTEREDFVRLTQRIGRETGGMWHQSMNPSIRGDACGHSASWLFLRGKALPSQAGELLAIYTDVLTRLKLDNAERLRQIVLEEKARFESYLSLSAAHFVHARLHAHWREGGWAEEQMSGISYLLFLRRLTERIDSEWSRVLEDLQHLHAALIRRGAMICNATMDAAAWNAFIPRVEEFIGSVPKGNSGSAASWARQELIRHEGLTMPTQVNAVGKGFNLYDTGYVLHGSSHVIANYLRTTWMWEQVRMKGGAYGAHIAWDDMSGVWSFLSSQDPNLLETLDVYDATSRFLGELELGKSEVTRSIIGVISNMDFYRLPDAKGWLSLYRYLIGETDEFRQKLRDEVLATTAADFRAFADVLADYKNKGEVVVLGSPEAIETANMARSNFLQITPVL